MSSTLNNNKSLQGYDDIGSAIFGLGPSSNTVTSINSTYLFPYINVQSGNLDNVIIGESTPAPANFSNVTASSLLVYDNTITLGQPLAAQHGFIFGTSFLGALNGVFTYTTNGSLNGANFSNVQIGSGSAQITSSGNTLVLGPQVSLPPTTIAYRPSIERKTLDIQNGTTISLDPLINVAILTITNISNISTASTVNLQLDQSNCYDGFLKTVHVTGSPSNVTVQWQLSVRNPGTGQQQTSIFTIPNSGSIQVGYDLVGGCWFVLDTGAFLR